MTTTITIANTTIGASRTISLSDADTQRWAAALIATQEGFASDTPAQAIARAMASWLQTQVALVKWFEAQQTQPAPITLTG